jgi:hypothetical protein
VAERAGTSPSRSQAAPAARRSATGWSRSLTPTLGRSARGQLGKATEFGYVAPLCELTDSTRPGQRGLILPAAAPGNPGENTLLPDTVAELKALGLRPGEVALDGGFGDQRSAQQLADVQPERLFVAGR